MDIITARTIEALVNNTDGPCVSAYLPTHRTGREIQQDPIRLRNLLDTAEEELLATGMRRPDARALLEPARELTRRRSFWEHQEDGLAVFFAPEQLNAYRLPAAFDPFVTVSEAFHVKPLWPVVAGNLFYILALSRNQVRLMWADRYQIGDVDLPDEIPQSLADALWFDDSEKQLQHRAAARAGGGRVVAQFHGHGTPDDRDIAKLELFLRAVDNGVCTLIDPGAPLVLAGVRDLTSRYQRLTRHSATLDDGVAGNPDDLSAGQLHRQAARMMEPVLSSAAESDAQAFSETKPPSLATVEEVVPAAISGRVAALFLPIGVHAWGRYDPVAHRVTIRDVKQPGDRDLLDLAGAAAWSAGGRIYATAPERIPGGKPVAALLRY